MPTKDKNKKICELCIHFAKGKEHLEVVIKIIYAVMSANPDMRCNVKICCDENNPEKLSMSIKKDHNIDELKKFIDHMLTAEELNEVWDLCAQ
tara:strand:+ start:3694 stop:3972 length:279 start_codon:yes stop_codon:yes gene_type:complete